MARSARRARRSADWVYRSYQWDLVDPTLQEPFLSGTYYNPITLTSGLEGATALVLVDSHNYTATRMTSGFDGAGLYGRWSVGAPSMAESPAAGALIKGVDVNVHLYQSSSSWFTTAIIHLGLRIIVGEQDPETGALLMHPFYSMWENGGGDQQSGPDYWANGRQNCWDWRGSFTPRTQATNANHLATWIKAKPRFNRRLTEREGLFLWCETHPSTSPGTVDLINPFCRTLVVPPD